MSDGRVRVELDVERGWLVATLDRPAKANALTPGMLQTLIETVGSLPRGARAVLIRGGERVFSGGVDLGAARAGAATGPGSVQDLLTKATGALRGAPVPVAALVEGACIGGAHELLLACDVRIATTAATFRLPATSIGVVYRAEGMVALTRSLAPAGVRRLLLLGETLNAATARELGLVDRVVDDPPAALAALDEVVERVSRVPGAFAAQKESLHLMADSMEPTPATMTQLHQVRTEFNLRSGATA